MVCTLLGWFLSSWLVLVWRLFQCHRKSESYTSSCNLWISGAIVLLYQVLAMAAVFQARSTTFGSLIPVLLILALHYVHKTICRL
jgi:amino acid transporter